ncbi:MAG: UvrD-helicase domain-containing protein [Puniceicoccales bacterium]|nr:UvrD-helicase domain-containing protein [Puniceicoccales bacterium]
MELSDQSMRWRFINEHDKNFSVIASAGVGKTTAITKKIASIIRTKAIPLDQLVIVTYTQKAAAELQQRTLYELQSTHSDLSDFKCIFFGTIHAFADKLLRNYGHCIGLAPDFQIEQNERSLWEAFLHSSHGIPLNFPRISTLLNNEKLYALLGSLYASEMHVPPEVSLQPPLLDGIPLLRYAVKNNTHILRSQRYCQIWLRHPTFPPPKITTKAKEFLSLYENVITPFEDWYARVCAQDLKSMATAYAAFRVQQKRLTFSDLIRLSIDLLHNEDCGSLLRQYYVILDEAQDTDQWQFQLLLGIAQPSETRSLDFFQNPPAPGRYCMIGDPQQSIYVEQADITLYQKIHQILISKGVMEGLQFSVTLRFGSHIAQNLNQTFRHILDGGDGQVSFSEITSGMDTPKPNQNVFENWSRISIDKSVDECTFLSNFFKDKNPEYFGVRQWSDIAILCPRKAWLLEIQGSFAQQPLTVKTQIHSPTKTYGEYREFSWISALMHLIVYPKDSFEFSGILREIFGIADVLIAQYRQGSEIPEITLIERQLKQWFHEYQHLSPLQWVDFLSRSLQLKRRLKAIQNDFNDEIEKTLRIKAASYFSVLEFSAYLKQQSMEIFYADVVNQHALQLYTFHKSKGLEWPVVLLPFINRKQTPPLPIFPKIVQGQMVLTQRQYAQWNHPNDYSHHSERLLYVALTRQKRQTIFIDDGSEPKAKTYSLSSILQSAPNSKNLIRNLPEFQSCENQMSTHRNDILLPQESSVSIKYALSNKGHDFKILTPTELTSTPELQGRCADPIAYGNWWHETMQRCPLKSKAMAIFLNSAIKSSPDVNLAQRDVEKLIQNTSFWALIKASEQIYVEYPFFIPKGTCVLEGRMDLLLRQRHCFHVVDWKTEHIENLEDFFEKHRYQIQNYRIALGYLFPNFTINASIYATERGELLSFR